MNVASVFESVAVAPVAAAAQVVCGVHDEACVIVGALGDPVVAVAAVVALVAVGILLAFAVLELEWLMRARRARRRRRVGVVDLTGVRPS